MDADGLLDGEAVAAGGSGPEASDLARARRHRASGSPEGDVAGEDGTEAEPDATADEESADRKPRRRRSWLTETAVLVSLALVIALTVKTYIIQPFRIPSGSMEDTLLVGDKVLVNKLVGHLSQIHRGDIVVFDGAGSWDAPVPQTGDPLVHVYRDFLSLFGDDSGQTDYIKRVIGLPGDHVSCCNAHGLLTVNGVALHETPYLHPGSAPSTIPFSIVVPPGRLWVMGDNRSDSEDSRLHRCGIAGAECESWDRSGTIPESMVIGRAFIVVWPPSEFRMLWVPKTFSQPALLAAGGRAKSSVASQADAASARVEPGSPALPLAAGAIAATPLTLIERRIRLRRRPRPRRRHPDR